MSKVKAEKTPAPTTTETALATTNATTALAATVADYGDDATTLGVGVAPGYENQSSADTMVPFMNLLQPMSKLLENNQEARAGMWVNSATGQIAQSFYFVPSVTKHEYVEWKPDRGGYAGRHDVDSAIVQEAIKQGSFGDYKTKGGNELVETFYVFGVAWSDTMDMSYVMIAFSSTKIKVYKQWMTQQRSFHVSVPDPADATKVLKKVPPIWAHESLFSSVFIQDNPQGKYWAPKIEPARGSVAKSLISRDAEAFQMAKMGRDLLAAGSVKADYQAQDTDNRPDNGQAPF